MAQELATDQSKTIRLPLAPLIAAWLIPGGGHFMQRRWGRGALLLVSIAILFVAGVTMQGRLFKLIPSNFVETLGFAGDLCSGLLFIAVKLTGYDMGETGSPMADYGTKFILVAGLLNVLCMLDAYDIAIGKKN
jgi:hypothetical protein